jgi:hypothetical protein
MGGEAMTRWKLEPRATLLLMHAHNQWSRWNGHLLDAADKLGLFIGYQESLNSWDGSMDREWYVMAEQLYAVGGMSRVWTLASELALA